MAIVKRLWSSSVTKLFPTNCDEYKECMTDFDDIWQFPCCFGAIDGCRIPIKCPAGRMESSKVYLNCKHFYSVIMMAIVDARCRFIWASCSYPGSSHDVIIFIQQNH